MLSNIESLLVSVTPIVGVSKEREEELSLEDVWKLMEETSAFGLECELALPPCNTTASTSHSTITHNNDNVKKSDGGGGQQRGVVS